MGKKKGSRKVNIDEKRSQRRNSAKYGSTKTMHVSEHGKTGTGRADMNEEDETSILNLIYQLEHSGTSSNSVFDANRWFAMQDASEDVVDMQDLTGFAFENSSKGIEEDEEEEEEDDENEIPMMLDGERVEQLELCVDDDADLEAILNWDDESDISTSDAESFASQADSCSEEEEEEEKEEIESIVLEMQGQDLKQLTTHQRKLLIRKIIRDDRRVCAHERTRKEALRLRRSVYLNEKREANGKESDIIETTEIAPPSVLTQSYNIHNVRRFTDPLNKDVKMYFTSPIPRSLPSDDSKAERDATLQQLISYLQTSTSTLVAEQEKLPIYSKKAEILQTITNNRVILICGETGSGKSTQVPAYVLNEWLAGGKGSEVSIVCTQPRRIAAISLAERVAQEVCGRLNNDSEDIIEQVMQRQANGLVGFQVRLHSNCTDNTRLLFCTTGVLLRKLNDDAYLQGLSHIVVDEVHERQIETDFLLRILKQKLVEFPHLKVILMSATLQEVLLQSYFSEVFPCPIIHVEGRTHPVEVHYYAEVDNLCHITSDRNAKKKIKEMGEGKAKEAVVEATTVSVEVEEGPKLGRRAARKARKAAEASGTSETVSEEKESLDSMEKELATKELSYASVAPAKFDPDAVGELCLRIIEKYSTDTSESDMGDTILVFLSGMDAIEKVNKALANLSSTNNGDTSGGKRNYRIEYSSIHPRLCDVMVLHGSLTPEAQKRVFRTCAPGQWRIVLATNIAETSITVPDVTHVIDAGLVKEMRYEASTKIASLKETAICRASMRQRAGRAGRIRPGHCWRLFSQEYMDSEFVSDFADPEMRRMCLEEIVLKVLYLDLGKGPIQFLSSCIEAPEQQDIQAAVESLIEHKAILREPHYPLTPLGFHLSQLPVDVKLGKLLIMGCLLQVIEPVLTIVAILAAKCPFMLPQNPASRARVQQLHQREFLRDMEFQGEGQSSDTGEAVPTPSDHLAIYRAYQRWLELRLQGDSLAFEFCREFYLSNSVLEEVRSLRILFRSALIDTGLWQFSVNNDNSKVGGKEGGNDKAKDNGSEKEETIPTSAALTGGDQGLIMYSLCFGMFPNLARLGRAATDKSCKAKKTQGKYGKGSDKKASEEGNRMVFELKQHSKLHMHPACSLMTHIVARLIQSKGKHYLSRENSVLALNHPKNRGGRDSYFIYHKSLESNKLYLMDATLVPSCAVMLFGGDINIHKNRKQVTIDGWLNFKISELHAVLYRRLSMELERIIKEAAYLSILKQEQEIELLRQRQTVLIEILLSLYSTATSSLNGKLN
jgi:ATP-dependent RNA helicase DHX29